MTIIVWTVFAIIVALYLIMWLRVVTNMTEKGCDKIVIVFVFFSAISASISSIDALYGLFESFMDGYNAPIK